ncbi:NAD(P)-binding protein [Corynespora cassiicola Philippines]|uniref:NAD(P)-binding protein n=1 Tax=Corynespora cassiicola Philippines TaxID=1448308 RepID=A0A2T2NYI6_CORCC|nr:NAD(P)-binding protein [Corynespora cassiicola Philippines]
MDGCDGTNDGESRRDGRHVAGLQPTHRSNIGLLDQLQMISVVTFASTTDGKHLTALDFIQKEGLEGALVGKVIVLTEATVGIGLEAARALLITGATLFLTARVRKKATKNLAGVLESGRVTLVNMDNGSLSSVRAAAATILTQSNNKVNILIANAGINEIQEYTLTDDGYEILLATNHLSHFLLFQLLKPALLASSSPEFHSRVALTTSSTHLIVKLNGSENYKYEKGGYIFIKEYAHSKLANIYIAHEIERQYGHRGLHGSSAHPGIIKSIVTQKEFIDNEKTPAEGAATTVIAARGQDGDDDMHGTGWVSHTYDPDSESRLWKDSLKLVGLVTE